jgi:hypothetical protein
MSSKQFRNKVKSPYFKLFLLKKLPLAFIAGVKVKEFTVEHCTTSLKFKWLNQNPFNSMYFAAMQMGAELSTGLLLYQYLNKNQRFSMLLVSCSATYHKKATGVIQFTCKQGLEVESFVQDVMKSEEGEQIILRVTALSGKVEVADFEFVWSCKKKQGLERNSRP